MSIQQVIQHFSSYTRLPVELEDVRDYVKENCDHERICFIETDLDTSILRGFFHQYKRLRAYEEEMSCVDIYYGEKQGLDWKRFVCCKELLHLLDPASQKTYSRQDVSRLIERIVLEPSVRALLEDGGQVLMDRFGTLPAIAVLFPFEARLALTEPYNRGAISDVEIAKLIGIPRRYARAAMSDQWADVHEMMISD